MRCASYTRLLSISDVEEVPGNIIAIQNQKISSYIKKRHWKLVIKYSDRKKDVDEESAFLEMKDGAISRDFDCLVVDSIFRCGKNAVVAAEVIKNMLLPVGIHFAVVEDDFCSVDVSQEEAIAYLDNKQSELRKGRVGRRVREAIEKRVYEKYGYLHVEKDGKLELIIDPETEPCIKRIYDLILAGNIFSEVANKLNEEGFESQRQHMKRVKNKTLPDKPFLWDASQVSKLMRNRLYMGEWERTIQGKKIIVPCPPIVSAEIFELAGKRASENASNIGNVKRKAVPNAYARRVFDRESGCSMRLLEHRGLHIKVYRYQYPKPSDIQYDKSYIPWTEFDQLVKEEIKKECQRAKRIIGYLECEQVKKMRENKIQIVREQAQILFPKMIQIENQQIPLYRKFEDGSISEETYSEKRQELLQRFEELDEIFCRLMDEIQEIETAYSQNNPWIKVFSNWETPEILLMSQVGKIIERIECERFERVYVRFLYENWKSYFPEEWLQLEEV